MNVVFIVLDTLRSDRLSIYNEEIDFTDNIEEFAEKSLVYDNAMAQAPWTLPSHASMFTGEYPWEHNATQKNLFLTTDKTTLAEKFTEAGYSTASYTANTWVSPYTGITKGFEDTDNMFGWIDNNFISDKASKLWIWANQGRTKKITETIVDLGEYLQWGTDRGKISKTPETLDKAEEFIESNEEDDFFLFMNLLDAHLPYYPPEDYREKHASNVEPSEVCQRAHEHNADLVNADFESIRKLYDAEADYLDDQLGRFFDYMEEQGLIEDTVFVIASDHGENLGEDDMYGHQFSVSEEVVNIPLLIRAPGVESGRVETPFELRELYNVIPRLTEIEDAEADLSGVKYALGGYEYPVMELKNVPEDKQDLGKQLRFVRSEKKKLIKEGQEDAYYRMIDLEENEEIDVKEQFRQKIDRIGEASQGDTDIDDEQVKDRLEDLGYM
ncbi:MAG: arylsulfatase A-like enzyme [Candidatus Nanohaloarchaea archaeon]|jgi:arylsulfatase A-like enzyme